MVKHEWSLNVQCINFLIQTKGKFYLLSKVTNQHFKMNHIILQTPSNFLLLYYCLQLLTLVLCWCIVSLNTSFFVYAEDSSKFLKIPYLFYSSLNTTRDLVLIWRNLMLIKPTVSYHELTLKYAGIHYWNKVDIFTKSHCPSCFSLCDWLSVWAWLGRVGPYIYTQKCHTNPTVLSMNELKWRCCIS